MEPTEQSQSRCIRVEHHPARMPMPSWKPRRHPDRHRGFTLVEMALIVAILGVLTTLVAGTYQSYRDRLKLDQASATS